MQLPEQVNALPAQHAVQRFRITRLNGRHQLEEEVVAVTAQPSARLAQPAVQLGPAGRCQVMDDPIWLHWLRLALRLDEPVPAQPVKDLIEMPDVQPAPLISDGLLEAALQFSASPCSVQVKSRLRRIFRNTASTVSG